MYVYVLPIKAITFKLLNINTLTVTLPCPKPLRFQAKL